MRGTVADQQINLVLLRRVERLESAERLCQPGSLHGPHLLLHLAWADDFVLGRRQAAHVNLLLLREN